MRGRREGAPAPSSRELARLCHRVRRRTAPSQEQALLNRARSRRSDQTSRSVVLTLSNAPVWSVSADACNNGRARRKPGPLSNRRRRNPTSPVSVLAPKNRVSVFAPVSRRSVPDPESREQAPQSRLSVHNPQNRKQDPYSQAGAPRSSRHGHRPGKRGLVKRRADLTVTGNRERTSASGVG